MNNETGAGYHYTEDPDMDLYKSNYLFMKHSPMYARLEQKYKNAKHTIREQKKMIELLNRQNLEIMEKYASRLTCSTVPMFEQSVSLSDTFSNIKPELVSTSTTTDTAIQTPSILYKEEVVYKTIEIPVISIDTNSVITVVEVNHSELVIIEPEEETEEEEEVVVEEEEEETEEEEVVVEEEETEEEEVVVEEEEEETEEEEGEVVVEEEEEETEEVVVEEEETEEEEGEVVVEEEEEETEEEEVVEEEEETEEEEEEGVYEVEIDGKRYYTTNDVNGTIYALLSDDDIGDEIGKFVDGKATFVK
jgi:hypothetical protein